MTEQEFRRLALSLPEVVESAHMDHPDFRVGGKIFATLGPPGTRRGMVKLPVDVQAECLATDDAVYSAAAGAWGRQGCTYIELRRAKKGDVFPLLAAAWRNIAPKTLRKEHPE